MVRALWIAGLLAASFFFVSSSHAGAAEASTCDEPRSSFELMAGPLYSKWDFGSSPTHAYSYYRRIESIAGWGAHLQGRIDTSVTPGVTLRAGLRLALHRSRWLESGSFYPLPDDYEDLSYFPEDRTFDLESLDLEVPIHVVFTVRPLSDGVERIISFSMGCSLGKTLFEWNNETLTYRTNMPGPLTTRVMDDPIIFDVESPYVQIEFGLEAAIGSGARPLRVGVEISRDLMSREDPYSGTQIGDRYFRFEHLKRFSMRLFVSKRI